MRMHHYSRLQKIKTLVFRILFCKYAFQKDHTSFQTVEYNVTQANRNTLM